MFYFTGHGRHGCFGIGLRSAVKYLPNMTAACSAEESAFVDPAAKNGR